MSLDFHGVRAVQSDDGPIPIQTAATSVIGLAGTDPDVDTNKFPLNEPVLVDDVTQLDDMGYNGTLRRALDGIFDQSAQSTPQVVVVRSDVGADEDATLNNISGDAAARTGVHALVNAEEAVFLKPRLLVSPGWTHQGSSGVANPVVAELNQLAPKLRAMVIADGPNIDDTAALAYAQDNAAGGHTAVVDNRAIIRDENGAKISDYVSSRIAGLTSEVHHTEGFWNSPTNRIIKGILGADRVIKFDGSDPNAEVQRLNRGFVGALVNRQGWRLWEGKLNHTNPLWQSFTARLTRYIIMDTLEPAFLEFIGKKMTPEQAIDVIESGNAYLRGLKQDGAIVGGRVYTAPGANPVTELSQGKFTIDIDDEPTPDLRSITFRLHRDPTLLEGTFSVEAIAA